ncbi:MAG: hypothetical protein NT040_07995 [Bacteroidetes bacterium]|nr:hypothetical protein [Bacteroidota bacterium]
MKNDVLSNRMNLGNHRMSIPHSKLLTGSIIDKYPVILDDGKTIIFIADKSMEAETRYRYELRNHH